MHVALFMVPFPDNLPRLSSIPVHSPVGVAVGKTGPGYGVAALLVMAFPSAGTDLVPFVVVGES